VGGGRNRTNVQKGRRGRVWEKKRKKISTFLGQTKEGAKRKGGAPAQQKRKKEAQTRIISPLSSAVRPEPGTRESFEPRRRKREGKQKDKGEKGLFCPPTEGEKKKKGGCGGRSRGLHRLGQKGGPHEHASMTREKREERKEEGGRAAGAAPEKKGGEPTTKGGVEEGKCRLLSTSAEEEKWRGGGKAGGGEKHLSSFIFILLREGQPRKNGSKKEERE